MKQTAKMLRRIKQSFGKIIIPRLPITRHTFNHLRLEINAFWVRLNNKVNPLYLIKKSRLRQKTALSVNVACGGGAKRGWINLDLMNHKNISLRYDCRRGLPLKEGTAVRIRCEHFLEHLDYRQEAPVFLKSCYQSLKEGGALRIVVPDAERFLLAYASYEKRPWVELEWDLDNLPDGFHTKMDIINHVFRQGEEHAYAYDFETLALLLKKTGFGDVKKTEFGISTDPELCDDLPVHKSYSLYVDAIK